MNFPRLSRFVAGSAFVAVLATIGLTSTAAQAQGMPCGLERGRFQQAPMYQVPQYAVPQRQVPYAVPQYAVPQRQVLPYAVPAFQGRRDERFERREEPRFEGRRGWGDRDEMRRGPMFEGRGRWGR